MIDKQIILKNSYQYKKRNGLAPTNEEKKANNEYMKKYRENNKENCLSHSKNWKDKNRQHCRKYSKNYMRKKRSENAR